MDTVLKKDIGERIKLVRGKESRDSFAQNIASHRNSLSRYERGLAYPSMDFMAVVCDKYNVRPDWLLTGEGPMRCGELASQPLGDMASMEAAAQIDQDAINVQELLNMTAEVLVSNTVYRPALAANIKAFHRSIALEVDNQELRSRIERLEERQAAEETRMATERKDMHTMWLEMENRLKKLEQENADLKRGQQEQAAQG